MGRQPRVRERVEGEHRQRPEPPPAPRALPQREQHRVRRVAARRQRLLRPVRGEDRVQRGACVLQAQRGRVRAREEQLCARGVEARVGPGDGVDEVLDGGGVGEAQEGGGGVGEAHGEQEDLRLGVAAARQEGAGAGEGGAAGGLLELDPLGGVGVVDGEEGAAVGEYTGEEGGDGGSIS